MSICKISSSTLYLSSFIDQSAKYRRSMKMFTSLFDKHGNVAKIGIDTLHCSITKNKICRENGNVAAFKNFNKKKALIKNKFETKISKIWQRRKTCDKL